MRAYRAIDRFDGRHPRAWPLIIMRRAEIKRHRRRRPHLLDDPDTDLDRLSSVDAAESPEELVVGKGFDEAVGAAPAALPDRHRQVVRLVDIGGLSYAEAAALLDVPEGTVMSRLHRTRKGIRTQLAAAGLAPRRSML
nr:MULTISPECIES: sigma-70 family RNA polymerase sigma factor [Streptomyces]